MCKQTCLWIAAVCLTTLSSPAARAQNSTSETAAQPAGATQPASSSSPAPATQPAQRVWTNDDLSSLRSSAPLSTVGKNSHSPKVAAAPASSKKKPANAYQDQIAKLRAQLPPIDSQISDLQAALSGKTVDSERKYTGVKPDSWQARVDQLQKKRDGIQSQVDALEDEARRSGVPTNSLP